MICPCCGHIMEYDPYFKTMECHKCYGFERNKKMTKELFLKIVEALGDNDLEDFSYEDEQDNEYGFWVKDAEWDTDSDGKYQYGVENGRLLRRNKKRGIAEVYFYGVSRTISRTGSSYSEWDYAYEEYEPYEIVEEFVPEVVVPAHMEQKIVYFEEYM